MAWWNAQYKNEHGEYAVQFGSKSYKEAKAVEEVCKLVLDGEVKSPEDISIEIRGHVYCDSEGYRRCSVCNEHEGNMPYYSYCPHCGTKLYGKENEK